MSLVTSLTVKPLRVTVTGISHRMEYIGAVGLGDDGEASGEVASAGEASDGEVPAQLGTDGGLGIPKKVLFF